MKQQVNDASFGISNTVSTLNTGSNVNVGLLRSGGAKGLEASNVEHFGM